jgi:hypothetical protein
VRYLLVACWWPVVEMRRERCGTIMELH